MQNSGETGRERGRGRNRYVPCKTYIIFKMTPVMSRTLGLWMEASPSPLMRMLGYHGGEAKRLVS